MLPRDLEAQRVRPGRARRARRAGRRARAPAPVEGDLDRLGAEVAQLRQRSLVDQPALAEDPDPVAQGLDLAQDVRGEEDRLPALLGLADASRGTRPPSAGRGRSSARRACSRSARLASAATSCTFWRLPFDSARTFLSRVELEALDELVAVGDVGRRRAAGPGTRASRRRSATATGTARRRRRPPAGGPRPGRARRRRRTARRRPALGRCSPSRAGSSSSCRPRSGRGSRTPRPARPSGPARRARPSSP